MPRLILKDSNRFLGVVSDADLKVLVDELEEEDMADTDYFVDSATVESIVANRTASRLLSALSAYFRVWMIDE